MNDLGTKRICDTCSIKFYDLKKRPVVCPKCNAALARPTDILS